MLKIEHLVLSVMDATKNMPLMEMMVLTKLKEQKYIDVCISVYYQNKSHSNYFPPISFCTGLQKLKTKKHVKPNLHFCISGLFLYMYFIHAILVIHSCISVSLI